jgi:hypothetical protein
MHRILLIGLFAGAFLIASALVSPAGPTFSTAAQAAEKQSSERSKTNKPDHFTKRGKQGGGGPAGLAVSDEGASGSKPTKKNK